MVIPGLYEVPRLLAESGLTEDDFLNNGLRADGLVFMVVVPELGACRVPDEALSHFMAGADEYAADGMPEHWSKQPSGPWTIKRDRLRVLADSWEKYLILLDRIEAALEPQAAPVVAVVALGEPNNAGPLPLTTNEIANCFAGLRGWDVARWKRELGSPKVWLKACQHRKGTRGRGGYESTWLPVQIAVALVKQDQESARTLRARFKKQEPLQPWFDVFEINIPDNSDIQ